jgi:hypothetical protein
VNEVLDLAKVEAGRLALHTVSARGAHTADAAIALVQPAAEARGLTISTQCRGDIDATYDGDEDRVRQILVNLLNNAVKFTEPGGTITVDCALVNGPAPPPEARLADGGGPWVCLSVTDTGIGIPADRIAAIFDPFVQVERGHTRHTDGSGLGLTISRRLARLMKGDLTVRSEVGKGSRFSLWLPAADVSHQHETARRGESLDRVERLRGFADIGDVMIRELDQILGAFVARLRTEPLVGSAAALRFSQLADHVGTYIADIGSVLIAVEEAGGQPSALVHDGTEIQRLVAERHGAQRARLGWTEEALHREWRILAEEVEGVIRRRVRGVTESTIAEALVIIRRFVEQSEELSCRALARSVSEARPRSSKISA